MKSLRRLSFFALASTSLLLFAACAAFRPAVRVNVDPRADFSGYRTFAFASPLGTDRSGYQSIVSQYLKDASRRELEARGLRFDETAPNLIVNFNAELNEQMRTRTVPTPTVGVGMSRGDYYGYRTGLYGSWPLYNDQTTVTTYQEGTLNIDVADARLKQLVWEGVVVGRVTQKSLDNLQPTIDSAVTAAFAKFPIAAATAK